MKYPKLAHRFPNKRAFITGAATGLGYALASDLVRDGWLVGINDIDATRLAKAEGQFRALGGRVLAFPFDISDETTYRRASGDFISAAGGIDLLVNNAGLGGGGTIGEFSLADWRKLIDVNLHGVVNGCHLFLPTMRAQNSGYILNIASAAAYHSLPFIGAYSASKAAVVSITETIHAENAASNISASVMISAFYKSDIASFTLGGELARKRTAGLTKLAAVTSADIASQTLREMEGRKPYIVLTRDGRLIYFLKRHFPNVFLRLAPAIARAAFAKAEAA